MSYLQFDPHPALADFIDAYWTVTGNPNGIQSQKILPDGCVDIILNAGEDLPGDEEAISLLHSKSYLVGTMTSFQYSTILPGTRLYGIRFKPAGFAAFYQFSSLHQVTDRCIEFDRQLSPTLPGNGELTLNYLNRFFLERLSDPQHHLLHIVTDIKLHRGNLTVSRLAERNFTTVRQLQRKFLQHIGVTPKEFINIVRYQYTFPQIKNNPSRKSLDEIALESGYYDHAHLSNEFKRYTGVTPSQL